MCEPTTLAASGIMVGAGISAYGSYRQGMAEERAAKFNARMARMQAADAAVRGEEAADAIQREGSQIAASQAASQAAGSVGGAGVDAQALALSFEVARDADRARSQAVREAWGLRQEAREQKRRGKSAATAGKIGAAGALIGGAGTAYAVGVK